MTTDHLNPRQFAPPGDEDAKASLLKQLKGDFPKDALAWLKDPSVRVDAPARVDPESIDWDDYPEWRASRQLKSVVKIAKKKLDKGKGKPSVMTQSPGSEQKTIIDGHHHALARVDHKEDPLAFVVHVPSQSGPWTSLHDRQKNDAKRDDFGKTSRADRHD